MAEEWRRRHAIQIVAQLPESSIEDALAVLELAKILVESFLRSSDQPDRALERAAADVAVLAFPASANSR